MNKPLVSVVLPLYNPDFMYLGKALDSICQQSYRPMELIISDDSPSSIAGLQSLVQEYKHRLDLTYVHNPKEPGIFSNLNNAIQQAKGEFVQIFSQDDIMMDHMVEEHTKILISDGEIGMVFSSFLEINAQDELTRIGGNKSFKPEKNLRIRPEEAPGYFLKHGCFVGNISPVMIPKRVFEQIGYFNEDLRYAADYEFWVRISSAFTMHYLHKPGLLVRHHPHRASQVISNHQLLQDLIHVYKILLNRIPREKRKKEVAGINKRVGAAFVHHAIRQVISQRWPLSSLAIRYRELNNYPFNTLRSFFYYIGSFPFRIVRRLL